MSHSSLAAVSRHPSQGEAFVILVPYDVLRNYAPTVYSDRSVAWNNPVKEVIPVSNTVEIQGQRTCLSIVKLVLAKVYFVLHQNKNFIANSIYNGFLVKVVFSLALLSLFSTPPRELVFLEYIFKICLCNILLN